MQSVEGEDGEALVGHEGKEGRVGRKEDLSVFLGSAGGDGPEGSPYLVLGLEKTRVKKGWGHV